MIVWWLCWLRTILMKNFRHKPYPQFLTVHDFVKPWWGVAYVLCVANCWATSYLGNPGACVLHVFIGWTLTGVTGANSVICERSPTACKSSHWWAICSAYWSRDLDATMLVKICESWLFDPAGLTRLRNGWIWFWIWWIIRKTSVWNIIPMEGALLTMGRALQAAVWNCRLMDSWRLQLGGNSNQGLFVDRRNFCTLLYKSEWFDTYTGNWSVLGCWVGQVG